MTSLVCSMWFPNCQETLKFEPAKRRILTSYTVWYKNSQKTAAFDTRGSQDLDAVSESFGKIGKIVLKILLDFALAFLQSMYPSSRKIEMFGSFKWSCCLTSPQRQAGLKKLVTSHIIQISRFCDTNLAQRSIQLEWHRQFWRNECLVETQG